MKAIILSILSVFLLSSPTVEASEFHSEEYTNYGSFFYNNTIVFVENQIEFAVFPDGQFDFSLTGLNNNWSVGLSLNSFSFNAGFNYNPYIQYDAFGAVVQIENTPIFYDNFGRVVQIGNIGLRYNRFGRLIAVGGLNVMFNNNVLVSYSGFINPYNRYYVYRPWHRYYVIPSVNYCVVYAQPYRLHYRPVRHVYYRPYVNNVRYSTVNSRRAYANTGRINSNYSERYKQQAQNASDRRIRSDYNNRYSTSRSSSKVASSGSRVERKTTVRSVRNSNVTRSRTETVAENKNQVKNRNSSSNRVNTKYNPSRSQTPGTNKKFENRTSRSNRNAISKASRSRSTITKNAPKNRSNSKSVKSNSRSSNKSRGLTTKKTSGKRNSRSPN